MSCKVVVTQAERDGCHARLSSRRLSEMGSRQGGLHTGSDDLWNSAKNVSSNAAAEDHTESNGGNTLKRIKYEGFSEDRNVCG